MKILFIHMTDIHCHSNYKVDISNFNKAICGYKNKSLDKCFLIFSGDLTFSGEKSQFNIFEEFIQKIEKSVKESLDIIPELIVVPGNHDIILTNDIDSETKEIKQELLKQKDCLEYLKRKGFDFESQSVVSKKYDFNDCVLHFNLINSSPFSELGSKDNDKGKHTFYPDDLDLLGYTTLGKKTIEILVSHHRPDWFDYHTQRKMDKYQNSVSTICFYGHEHLGESICEYIDEKQVIISKGGSLKNSSISLSGTFSILTVDTDNDNCSFDILSISKSTGEFVRSTNGKYALRYNDKYELNREFITNIINPFSVEDIREKDLFVMNILDSMGNQESINTFTDLISFVNENKKLFITGSQRNGKTVLLHRLFEYYAQYSESCIFYDCEDKTSKNVNQNIKNIFEEEYCHFDDVYRDYKDGLGTKVLIVDNFDSVEKVFRRDQFLKSIDNKFDIMIFSSKSSLGNKRDLLDEFYSDKFSFVVNGFATKQRNELIDKYLSIKNIKCDDDRNKIKGAVEGAIAICSILDMSDPGYLIQLLDSIVSTRMYVERDTHDAFSIIFDHSINDSLVRAGGHDDVDAYSLILSKLAFNVVFNKDDWSFEHLDLLEALSFCKKNFTHVKNIEVETALRVFLDSKLVKIAGDNLYRFRRNSILAYFASNEVIRLYRKNDSTALNDITSNILHGINGDIFIFTAYKLRNPDVFL